MRMLRNREKLCRLTATLLCLCMAVFMFAGFSAPRLARAESQSSSNFLHDSGSLGSSSVTLDPDSPYYITELGDIALREDANSENGIMPLALEQSANPSYTIQHYFWFPHVVQRSSDSDNPNYIPFIDTSAKKYTAEPDYTGTPGGNLPENGQDASDLTVFNVNIIKDGEVGDDRYRLETLDTLRRLFVDEETKYQENPQINYMSRLYNGTTDYNANYTLTQVWVYQPSTEIAPPKEGEEAKEKFVVYNVPSVDVDGTVRHYPERIRFTNNSANPHLTIPDTNYQDNKDSTTYTKEGTGKNAGQRVVTAKSGYVEDVYEYDYTILIKEGTIIRLVFNVTEDQNYEQKANFFDYNITDGYIYRSAEDAQSHDNKVATSAQRTESRDTEWFAYTPQQGINDPANYSGEGAKYGFGNANTKSGMDSQSWDGNTLNVYNHDNYLGLTFGLVSDIRYTDYEDAENDVPRVTWSDGVVGPNLFGTRDVTTDPKVEGKFAYTDGYKLGFYRQGGTLTLSYVKHNDKTVLENLRGFKDTNTYNTPPKIIWSNEFWPMDDVGATVENEFGHDLIFGARANNPNNKEELGIRALRQAVDQDGTQAFPQSDYYGEDIKYDHNPNFGMSYSVSFTIDPGYVAPLEYWFYGDDDMWVFIDQPGNDEFKAKLIADIGGVHSSAGEYVNLWDYVPVVPLDSETSQTYRLTVFYTERGESGSTCYMRFTLPLDSAVTPPDERDEAIVIEKRAYDQEGNLMLSGETAGTSETEGMPTTKRYIFSDNSTDWPDIASSNVAAADQILKNALTTAGKDKEYFIFRLSLTDASGTPYRDLYDYAIYDKTETPNHNNPDPELLDKGRIEWGTLGDVSTADGAYYFALKSNEYIVISNLPDGTYYSVTELTGNNYVTGWQAGRHSHVGDQQLDVTSGQTTYSDVAPAPYSAVDEFSAARNNYVLFTNSPALKTEVTPGDGKGVQVGEEIDYQIHWTNDTSAKKTLIIRDRLDDGVDFVGAKFGSVNSSTPWFRPTEDEIKKADETGVSIRIAGSTYTDETGTTYTDYLVYNPHYYFDDAQAFRENIITENEKGETLTGERKILYDKLVELYGGTNEPCRMVIWTRRQREDDATGYVSLEVRVNERALKAEDTAGKFGTTIPRVENSATVQVGNESLVSTTEVENPTWEPHKTETEIERAVGDDVTVDEKNLLEKGPNLLEGPIVFEGDQITYKVTWRNYENSDALITVRDVLDPNVKLISAEFTPTNTTPEVDNSTYKGAQAAELNTLKTTGNTKPVSQNSERTVAISGSDKYVIQYTKADDYRDNKRDQVLWNLGMQPAGSQGYVTLTVEVLPDATPVGIVDNTAFVKVGDDGEMQTETLENPLTNPQKTEETPGANAHVEINEEITYKITWSNPNNQPADIVITDPLDNGVDFVSASFDSVSDVILNTSGSVTIKAGTSAKVDGTVTIAYSARDPEQQHDGNDTTHHTVTWTFRANPKTSGEVTLKVKVNDTAKTYWNYDSSATENPDDYLVRNRAKVQIAGNEFTTDIIVNPLDEPDKTETNIKHNDETNTEVKEDGDEPNLTGPDGDGKYSGPTVEAGDQITYEITWTNFENTDAYITVADELDPNVKLISAVFTPEDTTPDVDVDDSTYRGAKDATLDNLNDATTTGNAKPASSNGKNPTSGEVVTVLSKDGLTQIPVIQYTNENGVCKVVWNLGIQPRKSAGKVTLVVEVLPNATVAGAVANDAVVTVGNNATTTREIENQTPHNHKEETTPGAGKLVGFGDKINYEIEWRNHQPKDAYVIVTDTLDPGVDFDATRTSIEKSQIEPETVEAPYTVDNTASGGKTQRILYYPEKGTYSYALASGSTTIDIPARTVVWDLGLQGTEVGGKVALGVTVNKDAPIDNRYNDYATGFESTADAKDYEVHDQARVLVDNIPSVTNRVDNPVTEKTEVNPGDGALVGVGSEITYSIDWRTGSDKDKYYVLVMDTLDPGVDYVKDSGKLVGPAGVTAKSVKYYEKADTFTYTDAKGSPLVIDGKTITETIPARTVVWDIGEVDKDKIGSVELKVTVNDKAKLNYQYNNSSEQIGQGKDSDGTLLPDDYKVLDQARVSFDHEPFVKTNTVENPVPEKTETSPGAGELVGVDDEITYTIRWENAHDTAADVVIVDPLDIGVNFVEAAFDDPSATAITAQDPSIDADVVPEPVTVTSEKLDGGKGIVNISYICTKEQEVTEDVTAPKRSVVWSFKAAPETFGYVTLKVQVNEKAFTAWDYRQTENEGEITSENGDLDVYNRAQVKVGDHAAFTAKVENPLPQKTETQINEEDVQPSEGDENRFPGVQVGDEIDYTVSVQVPTTDKDGNALDGAVVTVVDPLDEGLTFVKASYEDVNLKLAEATPERGVYTIPGSVKYDGVEVPVTIKYYGPDYAGSVQVGTQTVEKNTVVWTIGMRDATNPGDSKLVPAGTLVTVNLTAEVNKNAPFKWPLASGEQPGEDNEVVNRARVAVNDAEADTELVRNPVGQPEKTEVTPGTGHGVAVGDEITYEVTWKNYKGEPADVVITDKLDPGVDFVEADYKGSPKGDDPVYTEKTHTVTWTLKDQPAGATGTVTLKVKVNENAFYKWNYDQTTDNPDGWTKLPDLDKTAEDLMVYNRAGVKVGNDAEMLTDIPWNPLDHKSEVAVNEQKDIELKQNADGTALEGPKVIEGSQVTYRIYWANDATKVENGVETFVDAAVQVLDKLDPGADFVSATYVLEDGTTLLTLTNDDEKTGVQTESKTVTRDGKEETVSISYYPRGTATGRQDNEGSENAGAEIMPHTVVWDLGTQKANTQGYVELTVQLNGDAMYDWSYGDTYGDDTTLDNTKKDLLLKNRGRVISGTAAHNTNPVENPTGGPDKQETDPGDGKMVDVGEEITYEITWENYLDAEATIEITDMLDPGVDFVKAGYKEGSPKGDDPQYDEGTHTVTWTLKDQSAGATGTVTLTVRVNEKAAKYWDYSTEDYDATENTTTDDTKGNDMLVRNQAKVQVDDDAKVTRKVENPVPEPALVSLLKTVTVEDGTFDMQDGVFTFTMEPGDDNPQPDPVRSLTGWEEAEGLLRVSTKQEAGLSQNVILIPENTEYTVAGTYTYTVRESMCSVPGISIDGTAYTVTVTVSGPDTDTGKMTAKVETGDGLSFTNTYDRTRIKVPLRAEKTLEGADLEAGEFSFTLTAGESTVNDETGTSPMPDGATGNSLTVSNEASGNVPFGSVTYTEPGEYHYTIKENEPTNPRIVWDQTAHEVVVTVTAEGTAGDETTDKGALSASVTYDGVARDDKGQPIENRIPWEPDKEEVTPGEGKLVGVGEEITYSIHWENVNNAPAQIVIVDPLDIGAKFVSATFGDYTFPGTDEAPSGVTIYYYNDETEKKEKIGTETVDIPKHSVVWKFTADAGTSGEVTLTVEVTEDAKKTWTYNGAGNGYGGSESAGTDYELLNRAVVSVGNSAHVTNEVENPLNEKTEVTPGAGELVGVGEEVTYAIRWKNDTAEAAYVVVTDTLDPGVDYVSADNGGVYYPNAQDGLTINGEKMETAPRTVVWNLGMQKAGAEGAVTLTVKVNASAKQLWTYDETLDANKPDIMTGDETETDYRIVDRAKVIVGNEAHYTNDVENPVTEKTEVTPGDGELVGVGDEIVYSIIWANAYDEPAEVVIDDPLDLGLTFVSASFGEASEGGPTAEDVAKATLNAGDTEKEFTDIPASLSGSLAEDAKSVTIRYEKDETGTSGGRVVWRFKADRRTSGVVTLKVRVNESAFAAWDYVPNQNNGAPTENERDHDVYNRAQVQVGNRATLTNRVENPLPEKTEASPGDGEGVKVGQDVTYNVYWKNAHAAPATVVITDPLDGGVDFKSASFKGFTLTKEEIDKATGATVEKTNIGEDTIPGEADGSIKIAYDKETRTVTWTLTDRAAGSSAETEGFAGLTVTVNADAVKAWTYDEKENAGSGDGTAEDHKIVNRARVEIDNRGAFTNIPENPLPAKTEVEPGEGELVGVGDEITYEIAWKNTTGREAEIQIVDPLDAGVDLVEAAFGAAVDGALPEPRITAEKAEAAGDVESDALAGSNKAVAIEYTADGRDIQHADATVTKAPARSVIWTFMAAKDTSGVVTLRVKVNANAAKAWAYHPEGSEAGIGGAEGAGKDYEVADRAVVVVDNEPSYTNDVHNPVPEKTEEKTDATPGDGELVGVGDAIRYAIGWNNGENGEATVTVYDPLDMGVDFERAGVAGQAELELTKDTVAAHPNDDPVAVQSGDVTIAYYRNGKVAKSGSGFEIPPRTVVWTMQKRAAHASGEVTLEVTVNKKAAEGWAYAAPTADDATAGGAGVEEKDYEVVDRARVRVNDKSGYTAEVSNPVPEKTETDADGNGTPGDGVMVKVGDDISYRIHWKNDQAQAAHVYIVDPLDIGATFKSARFGEVTLSADEDEDNAYTETTGRVDGVEVTLAYNGTAETVQGKEGVPAMPPRSVLWDLGEQAAGAQGDVFLTVTVNENAVATWTYEAAKNEGAAGEGDDYQIVDRAEVHIGEQHRFTAQVENPIPEKEEVSPGEGRAVETGRAIDYKVHWKNGHDEAAAVTVRDPLDKGVDFVSAAFETVSASGEPTVVTVGQTAQDRYGDVSVAYDAEKHEVVWRLANRPAKEAGEVLLTVRVNASAEPAGKVENQAFVGVGNDAEVATRIIPNPLGPGKTETHVNGEDVTDALAPAEGGLRGPEVEENDTVTYRIHWVNDAARGEGSAETLIDARVTVVDPLDQGVDLVAASLSPSFEDGLTLNAGDEKKSGQDAQGAWSVEFDAQRRAVVWTLEGRAAGSGGDVYLTVRVNRRSLFTWQYGEGDTPTVDENTNDNEIVNRAQVAVENGSSQYTDIMHNPLVLGELTVTKTVTGEHGDPEKLFHFRVELDDKSVNGEYGQMTFKDGVAEIELKHGGSLTASGLRAETHYTVTELEANQNQYWTTAEGDKGVIVAGEEVVAAFVNDMRLPPVPETGDDADRWLLLMLVSGIGLTLTALAGRRRAGSGRAK